MTNLCSAQLVEGAFGCATLGLAWIWVGDRYLAPLYLAQPWVANR